MVKEFIVPISRLISWLVEVGHRWEGLQDSNNQRDCLFIPGAGDRHAPKSPLVGYRSSLTGQSTMELFCTLLYAPVIECANGIFLFCFCLSYHDPGILIFAFSLAR